jgi:hypothetical protein
MGGVFSKPKAPPPPKVDPAIEEARLAEEARKAALEKEQATYKDKVARGIIGSRSLFGKAGGRGFFG